MRRWTVCIAICCLLTPAAGFAQRGGWQAADSLSFARAGPGAAVVDGRAYVIGGAQLVRPLASVEEYSPERGTWTARAPLPTPRAGLGVCASGGQIYAIGGYDAQAWSAQAEVYDPRLDRWQELAPLPMARGWLGAAVAFGRIYAVGGKHNRFTFASVEQYSPATGKWSRVADMPEPRAGFGICVARGRIYVVGGGVMEDNDPPRIVATLFEYDPLTDVWSERAPLPTPRWFLTAVSVGGRIFALGGREGVLPIGSDAVTEYDPLTDTWTERAAMPDARHGLAAAAIGSRVYAIGGGGANSVLNVVSEYDTGLTALDVRVAGKASIRWASIKESAANVLPRGERAR